MRRIVIGLLAGIFVASLARAQTVPDRAIPGWCHTGAIHSTTAGVPSSTTVQGTVPRCTVTVYLTGTTTKAVIHGDPFNGVLPNPFTATSIGQWTFWAQPSVAYDIVLSGGVPPNTYPQPVTMTAVQVGGPGSGNTSPGGNPNELQFNGSNFFQGTTGLTWDSTNNALNYPAGSINANQINAATALTAGAITTSGAINASTVTATGAVNGASVNAAGGSYQVAIPWDTGQPNLANGLVGCVGPNGMVHACPVNSPAWNGIQVAGGPGSGLPNSILAVGGQAGCTFDGTVTVGDYVQPSLFAQGLCHDSGSPTVPTNGKPVMGQVVAAGTPPLATMLITSVGGQSGTQGPAGVAGPPGPPGGSLSYPGVVSDNNNGLNMQGAMTASSSQGYRQNSVVARSRNRDEVLQITVTPQDMPNCQNSGRGLLDDGPCFNAAINYLATQDDYAIKRLLVPYTSRGYRFLNPGFLVNLPYDFGDYHGYAGYITPASVGLTFINGSLQSCSVSGGSGYAPNGNLQVIISDPTLHGSGATATVQTDATGTPLTTALGCTVTNGGMNYPSIGNTVMLVPQGGHGAAGTCTLTAGLVTSPCSATTGGSGYGTGVPAGLPGLTCNVNGYPVLTTVVTNAAISAVTSTAGVLCGLSLTSVAAASGGSTVYTGNIIGGASNGLAGQSVTTSGFTNAVNNGAFTISASTATTITVSNASGVAETNPGKGVLSGSVSVPIAFGASCGGAQCSLMAPELPVQQPCAVALINGLTIEGVGKPTISTGWTTTTGAVSNTSQLMMFCDPTGQQSTDITVRNLNLSGFVGFYFPYEVHHLIVDNISFAGGMPIYAYSFGGAASATNARSAHARSSITNMYSNGWVSGAVCGAAWSGRNPTTNSGSMANVYNILSNNATNWGLTYYSNPDYGGRCAWLDVRNLTGFVSGGNQTDINNFDKWFEQYIWKPQNGPATTYTDATHLLSNGTSACVISSGLPTMVDRTTDYAFGASQYGAGSVFSSSTYPYYQCFPGVTLSAFTFHSRYSSNDTAGGVAAGWIPAQEFVGITTQAAQRSTLYGRFDSLRMANIVNSITGAYTDPYLAGQTRYVVNVTSQVTSKMDLDNVQAVAASPIAHIFVYGKNPPLASTINSWNSGMPFSSMGAPVPTLGQVISAQPTSTGGLNNWLTPCPSATMTLQPANSNAPVVARSISTTGTGVCAGWYSTVNDINGFHYPQTLNVLMIPTLGATQRLFIGYIRGTCAIATFLANPTPPSNCAYSGIRYDPTLSDTTWVCVSDDGTTGTGPPTTVALPNTAPSTAINSVTIGLSNTALTCTAGPTTVTVTTKLSWINSALYDAYLNIPTNTSTAPSISIGAIYGYNTPQTSATPW